MTDDALISRVLTEQDAFRKEPPSALPRMLRGLSGPVHKLTHRLIPGEAVEAAIRGADWAASKTIRQAAISHDFTDLAACEEAAAEVRRWALGYAVTGGGAAGAFGLFGLALDIPATIGLALRTARLTGLCYGFGDASEAERVYILDILMLAGANTMEERTQALERLSAERSTLPRESFDKIVRLTGHTAASRAAVRRVATVLGLNLSARKAAQIAPFVGAAVGAGVNASFQNDVARAARHAFLMRWLSANEGIVEGRAGQVDTA